MSASVIMGGAKIGAGARVSRAVVAAGAVIEPGAIVGSLDENAPLVVVGEESRVGCQNGGEA